MKPNRFLSLFIFFFWQVTWASKLPDDSAVPGGIVKIPVAEVGKSRPEVFYFDKKVLLTQHDQKWWALVGIPLSAKAGEHSILVRENQHETKFNFRVEGKEYPEQRITIKKKRMVTGFTDEDLKKINSDKKIMSKAKAVWSDQGANIGFITPVEGRLSSLFGLKRFFNDIPKRPHNGLDIAAPTGTDIVAPAAGHVINTGHYYFNGKTVFLDHGQGLLSAYLHMDEINVKAGQRVEQGEKLGTVGATGRVTGPHLHWIVYLNKVTVDPALFISGDIPRLEARNHSK